MSAFLTDTALTLNQKATVSTEGYALDVLDWIELQNASPYACKVQVGNTQYLMPAWYDFPIQCASYNSQGARSILPGLGLPFAVTPYLQTIPGAGFTQTLHTVVYTKGEQPPSLTPQPLGGSPVNLSIATSVVNTGDPAGTVEVFLIPHGDANPAGATRIYNNAEIILGDAAYNGILSLLQNGGDSFLLESNGLTQTDSTGTNLWTVDDLGNFLLGNANHAGKVQVTDGTNTSILNAATSSLVGLKCNSLRDNVNGNLAMDLSAGDGTVAFPQALLPNLAGTVLNGSTSGTATLYQWLRGTIKVTWVVLNNFRNGNAGAQNIALPVAYSSMQLWRTGNVSPLNGLHSSVAQNFGIITGLAAAGGSVTVQTQLNKFSIADQINPIDTISFLGSQASAYNGLLIIEGI